MKRFWTEARAAPAEGGFGIVLDGRPVRTPHRHALVAPTAALGAALAGEWAAVGDKIDPRAMPLTGLANAAIDIVAPDPARFAAGIAAYGETDLLAYRAESPANLVSAQAAAWDPLLDWARGRYDIAVTVVAGIIHQAQPSATLARLREATAARDPFALAALSPIVTIGGSLIAALALAEGAFDAEAIWQAVAFDELWQEAHWGRDDLAARARAAHRADYDAAVRFLSLLRAG
ncbi:MAG: ATPase [Sphingomonas sp. SCN 67-18]|uniref:ATP12 family chaperone protein n=1 Tax=uncultured Sphingomonas sp. TaxID=158754 RepID=UPI00086D7711|nr:ATP12 family protein [Sphingomonas sp. SCN 67-18]ODU19708.1 MAG: ATPase [Sphingomonas sp. SCN 67-18]